MPARWGIRRGQRGVRPYPRPNQYHSAACGNPVQRVQLRRRLRLRFAIGLPRSGHPGRQAWWSGGWRDRRDAAAERSAAARLAAAGRAIARDQRAEHRNPQYPQTVRRLRRAGQCQPQRGSRRTAGVAGARPAAARPPCCASSPAWNGRMPGKCCFPAPTPPTPTWPSAKWVSCSTLRAVPSHDGVRQRGLRPQRQAAQEPARQGRDPRQSDAAAENGAAGLAGGRLSRPAVRRPASAHRAGALALAVEPRCCCWTNPSARWTPRCARTCAAGCAICTTICTSPACSSPMIRKKRWKCRTGWW